MKIKRFEELNEGTKPSEKLNEKFWESDVEDVKDMKIKFEDDDELGYVPYLYIISSKGEKYYTKLKLDRGSKDYEDEG